MLNILVVDREQEPALALVGSLGEGEAKVSFIGHAMRAINNVRNNSYDVIVFGDRLEGGDTYDVGLELKKATKNKHAAVICIGSNVSRATRLANHLRPYSQVVDVSNKEQVAVCVQHLRSHMQNVDAIRKNSQRVKKSRK